MQTFRLFLSWIEAVLHFRYTTTHKRRDFWVLMLRNWNHFPRFHARKVDKVSSQQPIFSLTTFRPDIRALSNATEWKLQCLLCFDQLLTKNGECKKQLLCSESSECNVVLLFASQKLRYRSFRGRSNTKCAERQQEERKAKFSDLQKVKLKMRNWEVCRGKNRLYVLIRKVQ